MTVEVFLTGNVREEDVRGKTVVVVDVLRTGTTILTALINGARAVIPVADMAQAGKIASALDSTSYLLGGERDNQPIQGYHLGNSPLEYTSETVGGKSVILLTTSGTTAIMNARAADRLLVGSFPNAAAVVESIRSSTRDLVIVCAGWRNRVSIEDTLCAGLLLYRLWEGRMPANVSDTARIAFSQYVADRHELDQVIQASNHAVRLREYGFGDDVAGCVAVDSVSIVPALVENRIVVSKAERPDVASE